jgi:hypothetical protein
VVTELAHEGTDTVRWSITCDLRPGSNLENVTLTVRAVNGTGTGLDNVLTGNGAHNGLADTTGLNGPSGSTTPLRRRSAPR